MSAAITRTLARQTAEDGRPARLPAGFVVHFCSEDDLVRANRQEDRRRAAWRGKLPG